MHFLWTLRKLASVQKVHMFQPFLQNVLNTEFDLKDSHGKLRNGHGKIMEKSFAKSLFKDTMASILCLCCDSLCPGPAIQMQKVGRMIVLQNQKRPLSTDFFIEKMTPIFQNADF